MKRCTQAVILVRDEELEYLSTAIIGSRSGATVSKQSSSSPQEVSDPCPRCLGQETGSRLNQSGPFHHKSCWMSWEGNRPREAQSAGFSAPGT